MLFLGRHGKIFGPFETAQIDSMRNTGELERYNWLWDTDAAAPAWQPLDAAPPAPSSELLLRSPALTPAPRLESPVRLVTPPRLSPVLAEAVHIEAICHDHHEVMAGRLINITDQGCELFCKGYREDPGFGPRSSVMLNLLDVRNGSAMDVPARLTAVARRSGGWVYRVQWQHCPDLVIPRESRVG